MIVNFYKKDTTKKHNNCYLIATRNIECIPQKEMLITFSGQLFIAHSVYFNIDTCEYNIYMTRV